VATPCARTSILPLAEKVLSKVCSGCLQIKISFVVYIISQFEPVCWIYGLKNGPSKLA
jgi:hypothetical protein